MANTTSTLVSIKPGDGLVCQRDFIECVLEDDYRGACLALNAMLQNVETALTRRIDELEARAGDHA